MGMWMGVGHKHAIQAAPEPYSVMLCTDGPVARLCIAPSELVLTASAREIENVSMHARLQADTGTSVQLIIQEKAFTETITTLPFVESARLATPYCPRPCFLELDRKGADTRVP